MQNEIITLVLLIIVFQHFIDFLSEIIYKME